MSRWFHNLPIRVKAFAASAVLLICLTGLGFNAVGTLSQWARGLDHLSRDALTEQHRLRDLLDRVEAVQLNLFRYVAWSSNSVSSSLLADLRFDISGELNLIGVEIAAVAKEQTGAERRTWRMLIRDWSRYSDSARDTIDIAREDPPMGTMMLGGTDDQFQGVAVALRKSADLVNGQAQTATAALLADAEHSTRLFAIGGIAGLLLSLGITVLVSRSIVKPIRAITAAMTRVARGETDIDPDSHERRDEIGQMLASIATFRDKLAHDNRAMASREQELSIQNMRFAAAIGNMSQGLAMFDRDRRIIVCNERYGEMYRLPPELMKPGTTQEQLLEHRIAVGAYPPGDPQAYVAARVAHAKQRRRDDDTVIEFADGRVVAVSHRIMADGGWVSTHQDVTEQRRTQQRINHMANHDPLTDLPNRTLFRERMEQALARVKEGESVAVLCLDLDSFKEVNDTLGHPSGDKLLEAVAERLQHCTRASDTIARLGGDEFAIIRTRVERPEDVLAMAERIVAEINRPFEVDGHAIMVGASVGIAVAPSDGDSADELLKRADMALYAAKAAGRHTYRFFEPEMNARLQARRNLELDLRDALLRGEFELYYQPTLSVETRQVTGFEALIRWHHPERGLVLPGDFVPLCEEIGLINPIGDWVLRQACAEATGWPEHFRVAVNLSATQLKNNKGLVQSVASALAMSGLRPSRLELEITESVLLQENEATLATLHRMRALGVRIAMDDFGTGYSSLSYLRSFPFHKIKIDRSFVRELGTRADCAAIVRALAGLATSLGMTTTAEGVETEEQFEHLKDQGCDEVQGYLFGRPHPATELAALVSDLEHRLAA